MRLEFEGFGDVGGEAGLSMGVRTSGDRGFVHKTPSDALPSIRRLEQHPATPKPHVLGAPIRYTKAPNARNTQSMRPNQRGPERPPRRDRARSLQCIYPQTTRRDFALPSAG